VTAECWVHGIENRRHDRDLCRVSVMARFHVVHRVLGLALLASVVATTTAAKKVTDRTPPVITHSPAGTCPAPAVGVPVPCVVEAVIVDPSGVFDPTLLVRLHGTRSYDRVPMRVVAGTTDTFSATVPPNLAAAGVVEYLIEAFDRLGNGPARVGDEAAPLLLAPAKASPPIDAPPPPSLPPPGPGLATGPVAEDNTGLIVGVVAGVGAAVLVGAGVAIAVYALRPAAPSEVTLGVSAPSPLAGAQEGR
jgi:hypothetical protein